MKLSDVSPSQIHPDGYYDKIMESDLVELVQTCNRFNLLLSFSG